MYYLFLVEDASGQILIESMLDRIIGVLGQPHFWKIHSYKGIGRLPPDLHPRTDPKKRILLDQLPRLLRGIARSHKGIDYRVIVITDLDTKDCIVYKQELVNLWHSCDPRPPILFRIAIEEIEAWILGDPQAIIAAYPSANRQILRGYVQDSICGTWEVLADVLYPKGAEQLKKEGWPKIGQMKCEWAERIGPFIDVENNRSQSFQVFRDGLRGLLQ